MALSILSPCQGKEGEAHKNYKQEAQQTSSGRGRTQVTSPPNMTEIFIYKPNHLQFYSPPPMNLRKTL